MKIVIFLILMITSTVCFAELPSNDYNPRATLSATATRPYDLLINSVESNDTMLTPTTMYWDLIKPENGKFQKIPNSYGILEFAFIVDGNTTDTNFIDPNAVTFHFRIMAARWYSNAVIVCSGDANCGEMELSRDPYNTTGLNLYNAGSLALDHSHKWVSGIKSMKWNWLMKSYDLININEEDNGIARIIVDARGYGLWWCEITSIKGHPGRIRCVASGWQ
jgi:hypothetical protein